MKSSAAIYCLKNHSSAHSIHVHVYLLTKLFENVHLHFCLFSNLSQVHNSYRMRYDARIGIINHGNSIGHSYLAHAFTPNITLLFLSASLTCSVDAILTCIVDAIQL